MRPAKLTCEHASYNQDMTIRCSKLGDACANQRWCAGKGWCVLTEHAGNCPARKGEDNGRKAKAAPKRRNKV